MIHVVGRRSAECLEAAEFVERLDLLGNRIGNLVLGEQLADRTVLPFSRGTVVAPDVEDDGVIALSGLVEVVDQLADLRIGVFAETRVDLHQAQLKGAFGFRNAIPRWHGRSTRSQFRVSWNPAELLLAGKDFFAQLVPAFVEFAFVLIAPLLENLVRAMHGARRPIHKERLVRREGTMLFQPGDGLIGHILGEVILHGVRRFDRSGILKETWLILGSFSGKETVEVFEAIARRPIGERPHGRGLVGGRVVPLAESGSLIAVVLQDLGNRRGSHGHNSRVTIPIHRPLGDGAAADPLMIASGKQRRTGR